MVEYSPSQQLIQHRKPYAVSHLLVWFLPILIRILKARRTPFVVGVVFDDMEVASIAGDAKANNNEMSEIPGGIIGFKLDYWQVAC